MRLAEVDWRMLRGSITFLVLSVIVAGSALMASYSFASRQEDALRRERAALVGARSQYHALDEEENIIATYLPRYVALEDRGIIGREHRLDWIDALREAARTVRLQELEYVISAQRAFEPGMELNVGDYGVYASSMRLQLGLLHEGDLLALISHMHQEIPGLFGVSGCRLLRPERKLRMEADAVNVEAQCTLNFITIRKAGEVSGES